jgi:phage gp46-like protein
MPDIRLRESTDLSQFLVVTMDWLLRADGTLDDREELASSVRVALGTDRQADLQEVLPDPDSTDRRGWWGDMDAEQIWQGWPIGTRNWLLTRAKLTRAPAVEGDTLQRARNYTYEALQPFVDMGAATSVQVIATKAAQDRIDVQATIYRGPLEDIDLRFQLLWQDPVVGDD